MHSEGEASYLEGLRAGRERIGLGERVCFVEGLPHAEIVPTYQRATLFATASVTGSLDKVGPGGGGVRPAHRSSATRRSATCTATTGPR